MSLDVNQLKSLVNQATVFDCDDIQDGHSVVWVSPSALFRYWEQDNWYQRSKNVSSYNHELPFDGCGSRILSLVEAINKGIELPPIKLSIGMKGICFPDGRHRIMLFTAIEQELIPALIEIEDEQALKSFMSELDGKPNE
ncbi:hypothetical protein ABJY94_18485 [Vibrio parahaemolyticus]|uniref:hypothetical protein n=1 Tax=Vibrio parahaemolyticus TaxID=670 RepID=UPI0032B0126E